LVPQLPQAASLNPDPTVNLATVFRTANPATISVAESLLQDAGIEYLIRNRATYALIPVSRFPVEIQVRSSEVREARQLLSALTEETGN